MKPIISASVQSLIDSVVSSVKNGTAVTGDLTPIYELVEWDAGGESVSTWDNQIAVKIDDLAKYYFSDDLAFEFFDLDGPTDLTDELRLEYAIERAQEIIDQDMFTICVDVLPLVATNGAKAFLGFTMQSEGQGGPAFEWFGPFQHLDDYHAELERHGNWLVKDDFEERLKGLLAKWQR